MEQIFGSSVIQFSSDRTLKLLEVKYKTFNVPSNTGDILLK